MIDVTKSGHYTGDCRELLAQLPEACVQTCITSPPYWGIRDYGHDGQIGLEATPDAYVAALVEVFRGVRRALRDDGTLWLNLGDSYASGETGRNDGGRPGRLLGKLQRPRRDRRIDIETGMPKKNLLGLPWLVAFALQDDGWILRSEIIWSKPSSQPENADRPSRRHEHLFMLSKSARYVYDRSLPDPGTVWTVASQPYSGAHFATFPPKLIEPCVLAGSRPGDLVLDPFFGSGTTGAVAEKHVRRWVGFDLNPKYAELAKKRTAQRSLPMGAP